MDDDTLTRRICAHLGRTPGWAYRPDGPDFAPSEVAIFYGGLGDAPARAIGVRVYGLGPGDQTYTNTRRVQLRFRGARDDPTGANRLASTAEAVMQGLSMVGGFSEVLRTSLAPLGADQNGREERSDNYIITLDNLEAS